MKYRNGDIKRTRFTVGSIFILVCIIASTAGLGYIIASYAWAIANKDSGKISEIISSEPQSTVEIGSYQEYQKLQYEDFSLDVKKDEIDNLEKRLRLLGEAYYGIDLKDWQIGDRNFYNDKSDELHELIIAYNKKVDEYRLLFKKDFSYYTKDDTFPPRQHTYYGLE